MFEGITTMEMPHVPEICAHCLGHADSVSGIASARGCEHGLALPVLPLHFVVEFEAAASEHHTAAGGDPELASARSDFHSAHAAVCAADQGRNGGACPHNDSTLLYVRVQYPEHTWTARTRSCSHVWKVGSTVE